MSTLDKSIDYKTDERGNTIFEVEASNENLDLQAQSVLQSALLDSKTHFLSNGVVSYDHKHKEDLKNVIGEPTDVFMKNGSVFVRGILYKANKKAQEIIELLKDGSTRIKASVGGLMPQYKIEDGIEKVVSVLWNDLALTPHPVNSTVSPVALLEKSFTPELARFVKSLEAGYGTNSADFEGGRTLIEEDVEGEELKKSEKVIAFIRLLADGLIRDGDEAMDMLLGYGFTDDEAKEIIGDVIENREKLTEVLQMGKSNFITDAIKELNKAMGKTVKKATEEEIDKEHDEDMEDLDDDINKDVDEEVDKSVKKSLEEQELVDASSVLLAMAKGLAEMQKSIADMAVVVGANAEMQKSIAGGVVAVMETMESTVIPTQSVTVAGRFQKSQGQNSNVIVNEDNIQTARNHLASCGKAMDHLKFSRINGELNKSLHWRGAYSMSPEAQAFVNEKMGVK